MDSRSKLKIAKITEIHMGRRYLLRQRYGDPHIVLASYRKEVRNWPKLKFGDVKGFRLFFNFLGKHDGVAKEQNWNAINTPGVICMLVSKLLNALIDRWNRIAYNICKKT